MPYKKPKMTPKAAARARATGRAQARTRQSLMTRGDVTTTGIVPVSAALGAVYRAAASRRTRAGMTPSQRRRADVDPVVVQKRLAAVKRKFSDTSSSRTPTGIAKSDQAAEKADTGRMLPNKYFNKKTAAVREDRRRAMNSPTRKGYRPPGSQPSAAKMKAVAKPEKKRDGSIPAKTYESMRFSGRVANEPYRATAEYQPKANAEAVARAKRIDEQIAQERKLRGATAKPKARMSAPAARPSKSKLARIGDEERIARNRATDAAAGRYGKGPSDAEKIKARQEMRAKQGTKPAGRRLTPAEVKANKAAVAAERIKPLPYPRSKSPRKVKKR